MKVKRVVESIVLPAGLTTTIAPVEPIPTIALIVESFGTVNDEAGVTPNETPVDPLKCVPDIIIIEPVDPLVGVNDCIVGFTTV